MAINESIFPRAEDIPQHYQITPLEQRKYLTNGELRTWEGPQMEVLSPVCVRDGNTLTQQRLGSYPALDASAAMEALDAAVSAYANGRGEWPTMPVRDRIACTERFVKDMQGARAQVVKALMWEIGKTAPDAAKEFDRTVAYISDTIAALKEMTNKDSELQYAGGIIAQVRRAPRGPVLCMGPFNYPLNETFTTLIPAMIMGNPVVMKPAKYGILLHEPLLEAYQRNFPPGVVNTVYGDGQTIITPMMQSGKVKMLAFIGSSFVANKKILPQHPDPAQFDSVLGLDAANPGIICEDADLDIAVHESLQGSLSYNGQRCTALKRLFVHKKVHGEFIERFAERVSQLKIGMPWEQGVSITPLPEAGKVEWLHALVDDACKKGATIVNRDGAVSAGTVFTPAVLAGVTPQMDIYQKEQFGPIVPIIEFSDYETPINYIVASEFGQQASVFSSDARRVGRFVDILANQVSRTNINGQCQRGPDIFPFTGKKRSAKKTLSVTDALRVFSERSMVGMPDNAANRALLEQIIAEGHSDFLSTRKIE